jgi:hypothetical protein
MNLEPVRRVLDSSGIRYALIGAHAMAVRGYPRSTVDIDLLTADFRVLDEPIWGGLQKDGAAVDVRRGDADDPLGGVVHILLPDGTDVDVVLARWKWQQELVARAEFLELAGARVPVPSRSDLILLKLAAGGYTDLQDAAALVAIGDSDATIRDVEVRIGEVQPDVRALWRDVLAGRQR